MPTPRKKKSKKPKKLSPKKYQLKPSSEDLVAIQIAIRLQKVPKGVKLTRRVLELMIRRKAELSSGDYVHGGPYVEGPNPPGIKLDILRWANPGRRGRTTGWRDYGSQAERWGTLRRIIQAGQVQIQFFRGNE